MSGILTWIFNDEPDHPTVEQGLEGTMCCGRESTMQPHLPVYHEANSRYFNQEPHELDTSCFCDEGEEDDDCCDSIDRICSMDQVLRLHDAEGVPLPPPTWARDRNEKTDRPITEAEAAEDAEDKLRSSLLKSDYSVGRRLVRTMDSPMRTAQLQLQQPQPHVPGLSLGDHTGKSGDMGSVELDFHGYRNKQRKKRKPATDGTEDIESRRHRNRRINEAEEGVSSHDSEELQPYPDTYRGHHIYGKNKCLARADLTLSHQQRNISSFFPIYPAHKHTTK